MKKPSDTLFKLIQKLTTAEKRYIKRDLNKYQGKRENHNSQLFDVLNALEEYDEEKLLKKIKSTTLKKNFRVQKRYLQDAILESLRHYNALSSTEMQVKNQLEDCKILRAKGLYEEALAVLEKALKKAYKLEFYFILPELLFVKKEILQEAKRDRKHLEQIQTIYKELLRTNTIFRNFIQVRSYNTAFFFMDLDDERSKGILDDLHKKNNTIQAFESHKIKQLKLINQDIFYRRKGSLSQVLATAREALDNVETSFLKTAVPVSYRLALSNYIFALGNVNDYHQIKNVLDRWIKELEEDYWDPINRLRSEGVIHDYRRRLELLGVVSKDYAQHLTFDWTSVEKSKIYMSANYEFRSQISYHFIQENYEKTWQIILEQEAFMGGQPILFYTKIYKLLMVIIYFETNNLTSLISAVDKAKYFYKKNNCYTPAVQLFLNQFNSDYASMKEQFEPVYEHWIDLSRHNDLIRLWLTSKIKSTSMLELFRNRLRT